MNESTSSLLRYKAAGGPGGEKGELARTNWQRSETQTTCKKCIKYILFMGSKQRYLMRPLIVEIQGARRATGENFEIPLNKSEKVITQNDVDKIHSIQTVD